jgi:hypothetical protein
VVKHYDRGVNPAHLDTILEMPLRESSTIYEAGF